MPTPREIALKSAKPGNIRPVTAAEYCGECGLPHGPGMPACVKGEPDFNAYPPDPPAQAAEVANLKK